MVLNDEIDVTPAFTFSTLQTRSDIANTLINAILITLIIINLNSIVTKLILSTRKSFFRYDAWVRSFIFLNGDDITNIIQWLRHRSFISETVWNREKQPLYVSRLCIPIFARFILFVGTIISLIIGIPGKRPLDPCASGDYILSFNSNIKNSSLEDPGQFRGICQQLPVTTNLGDLESRLSFCQCQKETELSERAINLVQQNFADDSTLIMFHWKDRTQQQDTGILEISLVQTAIANQVAQEWYLEVHTSKDIEVPIKNSATNSTKDFRIPFPGPKDKDDKLIDAMKNVIKNSLSECTDIKDLVSNDAQTPIQYLFFDVTCPSKPPNVLDRVLRSYFNQLVWTSTETETYKIPVFSKNKVENLTPVCTTEVVVSRPLANMLPLAIVLILLFLINVLISLWVNRRGNTLDEVFLLVKDVLGLDVTSNPLETARNINIPLRKYRCLHGDRQHIGYLRGVGDQEVDRFVQGEVVSFCSCIERGEARFPELDRNV